MAVVVGAWVLWQWATPQPSAAASPVVSSVAVLAERVRASAVPPAPSSSGVAATGDPPCDSVERLRADAELARLVLGGAHTDSGELERSMIASRDERVRAAGWFAKAARESDDTRHDHDAGLLACVGDDDCKRLKNDQAWADGRAAALAATNELARLASLGRDPVIYAMALRGCTLQMDTREGACTLISAEQFAALDPDNQAAWLLVAGAARARNDEVALSDALYRASKAMRSDTYFGAAAALAQASWPSGTRPLSKMLVSTQIIGVESGVDIGSRLSVVLAECSPKAVADPARRQLCSDIAERLVGAGTTLLEVQLGLGIGERSGWPADQVRALRDQTHALQQALSERVLAGDSRCEMVRNSNEHVADVGRMGEMGAARLAMERSGQSREVLAQKFNRFISTAAAAAASGSASVAR